MKTRSRGFTLIELLIVIVIIGTLAAIALPRFSGARDKAHRSQMQSDLKTLISAQEAYFEENMTYADAVSKLDFNETTSVKIEVLESDGGGWSARSTHISTPIVCGIYVGPVTPPPGVPLSGEGIVGCDD